MCVITSTHIFESYGSRTALYNLINYSNLV